MDTSSEREQEHLLRQPNRPLFTLSVEDLQQRVQPLYDRITSAVHELEEMVDAIRSYAVFAEYYEKQSNALADVVREAMALMQSVTSQQHITPEWMARRDVLAARMRVTINKHHESILTTNSSKRGITPP